jgi:undecaprenyl diphosphate synthase
MKTFKEKIDLKTLPSHIAIIMDGNGRWAKQKGLLRTFGHESGVKAVREAVEGSAEIGIKFLSLYAFSTENWNRPKYEVNALMKLLVKTINKETKTLMDNDIKLNAIGDLESLPKDCRLELMEAMEKTANHKHMTLTLALSYSSRWEIVKAVKDLSLKIEKGLLKAADITEEIFSLHLETANMPDPELLIRTSGEHRISNFLLWQLSYSELFFTNKLWPEFTRDDLFQAIFNYQQRERRFGMTSEQLENVK